MKRIFLALCIIIIVILTSCKEKVEPISYDDFLDALKVTSEMNQGSVTQTYYIDDEDPFVIHLDFSESLIRTDNILYTSIDITELIIDSSNPEKIHYAYFNDTIYKFNTNQDFASGIRSVPQMAKTLMSYIETTEEYDLFDSSVTIDGNNVKFMFTLTNDEMEFNNPIIECHVNDEGYIDLYKIYELNDDNEYVLKEKYEYTSDHNPNIEIPESYLEVTLQEFYFFIETDKWNIHYEQNFQTYEFTYSGFDFIWDSSALLLTAVSNNKKYEMNTDTNIITVTNLFTLGSMDFHINQLILTDPEYFTVVTSFTFYMK